MSHAIGKDFGTWAGTWAGRSIPTPFWTWAGDPFQEVAHDLCGPRLTAVIREA